jgi:methionyl-tRNA formyltransferase
MAELGAPLVVESLINLERGEIAPIPQDSTQASYAPILTKEQGRIDWSLTAGEIYNRIRGLAPWPGTFSTFRGRLCHIWGRPSAPATTAGPALKAIAQDAGTLIVSDAAIEVICGNGTRLQLEAVQIEGRKRVSAREFVNGARLGSGERFGV